MFYEVDFKPRAIKDIEGLSASLQRRILTKVEAMRSDLAGDVKKLTDFNPEYRLRVGDYRLLFEVENNIIVIYRVVHRKDAY